jgi:hypothetical protein
LMCVLDLGREGMPLLQIDTTNHPVTDEDFFRMLHRYRDDYRGWKRFISLRTIVRVRFVYFLPQIPQMVEVLGYNVAPPEGAMSKLVFRPLPESRVIAEKVLMHCYDYPEHLSDDLGFFPRIPRKLGGRIPRRNHEPAWGIELAEGLSRQRAQWMFLAVTVVAIGCMIAGGIGKKFLSGAGVVAVVMVIGTLYLDCERI